MVAWPAASAIPKAVPPAGSGMLALPVLAQLRRKVCQPALSHSVWSAAAAALPLVAMILWLTSRRAAVLWPVLQHSRAYLVVGLSPLIVLGLAWIFYADLRYDGHAGPQQPFAV